MQKVLNRLWGSRKAWIFFIVLFLFATFPGKGGFEGAQREIPKLSLRNDNWGFITPFYYGSFPELSGYWRYALVLIQLFALWVGLYILTRDLLFDSSTRRLFFISLIIIASVFGSQLWRDSTLFCFAILGLSLIKLGLDQDGHKKNFYCFIGIIVLNFGLMFKPIYSIIFVAFIFFFLFEKPKKRKLSIAMFAFFISLPLSPYLIDKTLSNSTDLIKVYPEQQPMIYDLAALYCWGNTEKSRFDASIALKLVLKENSEFSSVCSFLILTSWDSLHTDKPNWEISSPIRRITTSDEEFNRLKSSWLNTVVFNFRDYLMAKKPFLAEVLTMANSFVKDGNSGSINSPPIERVNDYSWRIFYYFAVLFDKFRLLTVGFALIIFVIYFITRANEFGVKKRSFLQENILALLLFLNLIALAALATVAYVANNGRYVLPAILTTWIFFMRLNFKLQSH